MCFKHQVISNLGAGAVKIVRATRRQRKQTKMPQALAVVHNPRGIEYDGNFAALGTSVSRCTAGGEMHNSVERFDP